MVNTVIDPFLQSAQMVLNQVINVSTNPGEAVVADNDLCNQPILIKISINGQVNGDVVLEMEEGVAIHIVERMMGGMKVTQINDMEKSAISELGNMISGNASIILYNQGIKVDITPPQVLEERVEYYTEQTIKIPLCLDGIGQVKMMLSLI